MQGAVCFSVVVPDGFDVVPIRVIDERGLVARSFITMAWTVIISRSGGLGCLVECLTRVSAVRIETHFSLYNNVPAHDSGVGALRVALDMADLKYATS